MAAALVVAAGAVAAATTGPTSVGPDPSGVRCRRATAAAGSGCSPRTSTTTTPSGGFEAAYDDRFSVYHGFADTAGTGRYQASMLSAHDGMLDMHLGTTEAGTPLAGGIVPLVDGSGADRPPGRYSIRMKSDEVDGYGVAVLLWSDENVWARRRGRLPGGRARRPRVPQRPLPGGPGARSASTSETDASLADWHTYTIEWTPDRMSFFVDDEVVGQHRRGHPVGAHAPGRAGRVERRPPAGGRRRVAADRLDDDRRARRRRE